MRVKHLEEGEAVWLRANIEHKLVCCSCGRTHWLKLVPSGAGVVFQMWDDDESTEKERKKVLGRKK